MKPIKNRIICPSTGRIKMLFGTEKQALNFIKFNKDEVEKEGTHLRAYYCDGCGGWHITSKPYHKGYDYLMQHIIDAYNFSKNARKKFRKNTCLIIISAY